MEHTAGFFKDLTPKQVKALPLLAAGEPAVEVSRKLKISKQSLSEWRQNEDFTHALVYMRKEALFEAVSMIQGLANDAVHTLKTIMENASNDQTKLRAAIFVIEHVKLNEFSNSSMIEKQDEAGNVNMEKLFDAIGL